MALTLTPRPFTVGLLLSLLLSFFALSLGQTITSISVDHGPRFGGTSVVIDGDALDTVTSVTVNGVDATIQAGGTASQMTIVTGDSNPDHNGMGPIEFDSVATTFFFTYIDPVDVEDVINAVHTVALGDYVEVDLGTFSSITFTITSAPANGIVITQFDDSAITGPYPVTVTDTVGARIKITFPSTAGRVDGAVNFMVATDSSDKQSNHLNVLAKAAACAVKSLVPPIGVDYIAPPAPTGVQIVYNSGAQTFDFTVSMAYLRDNAIISLDFAADYEPNVDGIRNINNLTTCNSRDPLASTTLPFYDLFYSAPTSTFPNALDGSTYKAYPATASQWTLAADNGECDKIQYKGSFSFAELVGCKTIGGASSITVTADSDTITYAGDLWVDIMQPIDPEDEDTDFHTSRFRYPFSFEFSSGVSAISTFTSTQNLLVDVLSADIATADPRILTVVLKTTSSVFTDSTLTPVSVTGLFVGAANIGTVSSPTCGGAATCVQTWTYTSSAPWNEDFNGEYRFTWSYDGGASEVNTVLDLQQVLTPATTDGNLTIATVELSFHDNLSDMQNDLNPHSGAFGNGDRVFVRATLGVDGGASDNFDLVIDDLYICWEDNAVFDIALPEGCEASFIPSAQVIHLIADGDADTTNNPAQRFNPEVISIPNHAAAAAFDAQPLATRQLQKELFHLHLKATIVQNTRRSSFSMVWSATRATTTDKSSLATFTVEADDDEDASAASSLTSFFWRSDVKLV